MTDFQFGNVEHLKRNLEIEGEKGTELGLEGGITLTVLAATDANPMWRARRDTVRAELNRLTNAKADPTRTRTFLARIYSETIVKGWSGVVDSQGNAIPFTRDACEAFLYQVDDAFNALEGIIFDTKNFRGQRIEAIVENLKN